MYILRKIFLAGWLVALTACASFKAEVMTSYDASKIKPNETFIVMPYSEQSADSSIFQEESSLITSEMIIEGFIPVTKPDKAKYHVFYEFRSEEGGIAEYEVPVIGAVGKKITSNASANLHGNSYYYSNGSSHSYYASASSNTLTRNLYGVVGYETRKYMQYNRILFLDIYKNMLDGTQDKIYSGIAINYSDDPSLENIKSCLAKALFKDFLGENGLKREVKLENCELKFSNGFKRAVGYTILEIVNAL